MSASSGGCSLALSPRRKRPSRRRPTIAIDGERRATRPRRGDRHATQGGASFVTIERVRNGQSPGAPPTRLPASPSAAVSGGLVLGAGAEGLIGPLEVWAAGSTSISDGFS